MEAMLTVGNIYCDQQNRIWTTHMTPAQYMAKSILLFLQDKTESATRFLHCILITNPKTTEMRTSQWASDQVFNENSSAWPTHYSIRAGQGRASRAAKYLH